MGAELREIEEAYKWIIAKAKNCCSHIQEVKYLGMRMQISTTKGLIKHNWTRTYILLHTKISLTTAIPNIQVYAKLIIILAISSVTPHLS